MAGPTLEERLAAAHKTIDALMRRVEEKVASGTSAFALLEQNIALERVVSEKTRQLEAQRRELEEALSRLQGAQNELAQAQKLEALGRMAAGAAHEINNPLAFILANLSFVAAELSSLSPERPEVACALEETRVGALRVREIVRTLKTFSRPDDKRDETVDVREVIQLSLKLVQNQIRHRARLTVELLEVPPVAANAHRLGQVFVNLLLNAAQAMRDGHAHQNELRVSCRPAENGRVLVEIADTGCGIPPDALPRIFEPFFTTKPVGMGTGLGLSICHGIVTGLGGEIQVESETGRGARFRVLLPPAGPGPAPAAKEPPIAGRRMPRARILVVDDEPLVGRAIERMLARQHLVVLVTSAEAALARLREKATFDAILCDLMMPEMTGMELHHRLLQTSPELGSRMIFLTGGVFTDEAREFLNRVPNACLEKPFDPELLQSALHELLARDKQSQAEGVQPLSASSRRAV